MNHILKVLSLMTLLVMFSCSNEEAEIYEVTEEEVYAEFPEMGKDVMILTNEYRSESYDLNTLEFSQEAYDMALAQCIYMADSKKLEHANFSNRASKLASKVDADAVAENIAAYYTSAEDTFVGWTLSEGHNKNLLGDFTHAAVAVISNSKGEYFYTQVFFKKNVSQLASE
ncbi:CAP domain-containing protein [Robertkochia solimangrovi]|uniref:CAP domain-containing protein n=1 Tax=Robertkochia solimangrovi TaxID=2213046 RepID=UPI00117EF938|nr:CAP domain-containing protein [Robertkochia solimangrovi]